MKEAKRESSGGRTFVFEIDSALYPLYKYLMKESTDITSSRIFLQLILFGRYNDIALQDMAIKHQKTFPGQMEELSRELMEVISFYSAFYPRTPGTVKIRIKRSGKPLSAEISSNKFIVTVDFAFMVFEGILLSSLLYELGHDTRANIRLKENLTKKLKLTKFLAIEKKHANLLQLMGISKFYNILASFFIDHNIQKNADAAFGVHMDTASLLRLYKSTLEINDSTIYEFMVMKSLQERGEIYLSTVFIQSTCQFFMTRFTAMRDDIAGDPSAKYHNAWLERIYSLSPSDSACNTSFALQTKRELAHAIAKSAREPEKLLKQLDALSKDILEMDRRYNEVLQQGMQKKEMKIKDKTVTLRCYSEQGADMIAAFISRFYERAEYWLNIDQALFERDMRAITKNRAKTSLELAKAARQLDALMARLMFPRIERF